MKLIHFKSNGGAQSIRMALFYCRVEFEDQMVTTTQYHIMNAKKSLPFGQLPVLIGNDGTVYSQSNSILRFVC